MPSTKLRISIDDACASDIRVAELADKHDIEAIFYWPVEWHMLAYAHGYKPLPYKDAERISQRFEIGSHTITHRHLTSLTAQEAHYEIAYSKPALMNFFRVKISKFCPPRGYTNEHLTDFTLKIYKEQRLTRGKGLVHVHPNSGANNNIPWQDCIDEDTTELWGHSHEWDKFDMWDEIEDVFKRYGTHGK